MCETKLKARSRAVPRDTRASTATRSLDHTAIRPGPRPVLSLLNTWPVDNHLKGPGTRLTQPNAKLKVTRKKISASKQEIKGGKAKVATGNNSSKESLNAQGCMHKDVLGDGENTRMGCEDCLNYRQVDRPQLKRSLSKDKSLVTFMDRLNLNTEISTSHGVKQARTGLGQVGGVDQLGKNIVHQLSVQDADGDTLLMLAIIQDSKELAMRLMQLNTDPAVLNVKNDLFQTALHLSVLNNDSELVRELVIRGADLTAQDRNGDTALHIACKRNSLACIIALTTVITPIDREKCSYPVSQQIPQKQDIYNYKGQTCLHVAVEYGLTNLVMFFLESRFKADINAPELKSGRTILHMAAEKDNYRLVKYLLKFSELNIDQLTYSGCTAIDLAKCCGHTKVLAILKSKGATLMRSLSENYSHSDDEENDSKLDIDDFALSTSSGSFTSSVRSLSGDNDDFDDICFSGKMLC